MKAIILSAGQGSRLLPLTENTPKCLLKLHGEITALGWQLSQLKEAGISEAIVVTGFHAEKVESALEKQSLPTRTIFNPFYKVADNLGSVWMAGDEMREDFLLINGDTLFTADVVRQVVRAAQDGITVTVSRKESYDDDDMKVIEENGKLLEIGKKIQRNVVNAESIGMIMFKGGGVDTFRRTVAEQMRQEAALGYYYLSIIGTLATKTDVHVTEVPADSWCETDFPPDLERARECLAQWSQANDKVTKAA